MVEKNMKVLSDSIDMPIASVS